MSDFLYFEIEQFIKKARNESIDALQACYNLMASEGKTTSSPDYLMQIKARLVQIMALRVWMENASKELMKRLKESQGTVPAGGAHPNDSRIFEERLLIQERYLQGWIDGMEFMGKRK
jgi:hypothetical protein